MFLLMPRNSPAIKISCVNKDKEIDSLQGTTRLMRNKYDDIKEELTKKEAEQLAVLQKLRNDLKKDSRLLIFKKGMKVKPQGR